MRAYVTIIAVFLVISACVPLLTVTTAYWQRDGAFPTLLSFGHRWSRAFLSADSCSVEVVLPPSRWTSPSASRVLRVDYQALPYTGIIAQDIYPHWAGYRILHFDIYSESAQAQRLLLRIDDTKYNKRSDDRFNLEIDVNPGENEFKIPLDEIARGPENRMLDLSSIKRIVLFSASHPRAQFALYLSDFALE